jgi:hypothetical protein
MLPGRYSGASAHEVEHENDDGHDEKDVDEPAGDVEGQETEQPKDDEKGGETC